MGSCSLIWMEQKGPNSAFFSLLSLADYILLPTLHLSFPICTKGPVMLRAQTTLFWQSGSCGKLKHSIGDGLLQFRNGT